MRRILLICVCPILLCCGVAHGQVDQAAQPPIIGRIIVRTHDIFDSTEADASFLFRLTNALHVRTRPSVVRSELLVKEGEPFDSSKVAETLRNLRARGLFHDVTITVLPNGDRVDLLVDTYDGWSTQLILNGRLTGGEFSWALGGREQNLLGTGAQVGLVYRDEPDRTAWQLSGGLPRIRGTRAEAQGYYDNLSDGSFGAWAVGVPFKSLSDRTALILAGEAGLQRVLQFRDGDSSQTYRRRLFVQRGEMAFAPRAGSRGFLRFGLAGQVKREEYSLWADSLVPVADSVSGAIAILADFLAARFTVVTHYAGFAREQDLDLSTRVTIATWLAPAGLGYARTGIGPSIRVQTGLVFGQYFARLQASANGLFTSAGLDSGQVRVAFTAASQVIPRHATVLHVEYGARKGVAPGAEFDLGHGVGPRSFGPHAFSGEQTLWGTLEHRAFLVDELGGLLGVGVAVFLDYGGAWYRDQEPRYGGDVGFGLRLGSTRSTGANVGRFDLGYRFGEGWEGSRWAFSLGRGFAF